MSLNHFPETKATKKKKKLKKGQFTCLSNHSSISEPSLIPDMNINSKMKPQNQKLK